MAILNTQDKGYTVAALVELYKIGETIDSFKEKKEAATARIAETFMTIYHAKGMTRETAKGELAAIVKAVAVKLDVEELPESDLAGCWRQYKSDTLKALDLTADDTAVRKEHTTMSALKKFILSRGILDRFHAAAKAFKENARKVKDVKARDAHLKRLDGICEAAMRDLAQYAEKHAIPLVSTRGADAKPAKPAKDRTRTKRKDAPIIKDAAKDAPAQDGALDIRDAV